MMGRFSQLKLSRWVVVTLMISIVLLGCASIYFVVAWNVFGLYLGDQSIPYFFYVSLFKVRPSLGLVMLLIVGALILFGVEVVFRQAEYSRRNRVTYGLALAIWFFANLLACGAALPGGLSGEQITQYGDEHLGSHLYRLDFVSASNGPGANTADFELWMCDSVGLICSRIHDEDLLSGQTAPVDDTGSLTAHLIVSANSIAIQINDSVVYTYKPQ